MSEDANKRDDARDDQQPADGTDSRPDQSADAQARTPDPLDAPLDADADSSDATQSDELKDEAGDQPRGGAADAEGNAGEQERSMALMLKARLAEIRDPEGGESFGEIDQELAETLLALVLGELSKQEREDLLERAKREPQVAMELKRLSAHLQLHQNVSRLAPRGGSFSRLKNTMRENNLLDEVIPGRHSLWRRSALAAVAVLALAIMAKFVFFPPQVTEGPGESAARAKLTEIRSGNSESRLVNFNTPVTLGDGVGELLLTSGARGVRTQIRMAPNSRFVLESANVLRIEQGGAERIEVDPFAETFSVLTPHARFELPQGGLFSVNLSRSQSHVCVMEGRVQVKPLTGAPSVEDMRTVYPGRAYLLGEEGPIDGLYPEFFLKIRIEAIPGTREKLRIRFINQSGMELRILRPQGDWMKDRMLRADVMKTDEGDAEFSESPVFEMVIDQDQRSASEDVVGRVDRPLTLKPVGAETGSTRTLDEQQWLTLAADGAGSQVEYEADLLQVVDNLAEADYTLSVTYDGPIRTEHFGERSLRIPSTNLRLNLKPKDGRMPKIDEDQPDEQDE